MAEIGQYLKAIRSQQGFSLKDVYKKTGISDSKLLIRQLNNRKSACKTVGYVVE